MRTLAIGDIHGCITALDTLLEFVEPAAEDHIVTLGDYVDRGPNSKGVIDRVLGLRQRHDVACLRGNHEIMMQNGRDDEMAFHTWMMYGGEETMLSYGVTEEECIPEHLVSIPEAHWLFLDETCLNYYQTETHIFVHANVWPALPLEEQSDSFLFWERFANNGPHCSGKKVVCGHSSQKSGWPLNVGHSVCIDTWVYGEGWLTCLDVESGKFWQANEKGERRTGLLA
ncbi:metallophosphoesterase family protein [Blastopirellula marina]|uniref:Serine/threonine protein phosphatase n=1 Tax=Blastopirellula marina TaxID=124 RepID=A0A2S8FHY4_9BACT|nr:metallophosphoesterase family protein [Blastopirellula marina]PQO31789.1 serine/threonine protein phosphatase [Blastopirellula marina]PTL43096.1 serine/threonine protein phosphatase [Blastopirellula marina]